VAVTVDHCPSAELLELLLTEGLEGAERELVETHVESCAACQKKLEQMTPSTTVAPMGSIAIYASGPEMDEHFLKRLKQLPMPRPVIPEPGFVVEQVSAPQITDRFEGRRLGQYEVHEKIGMGNMGAVYKALHVELGKIVALKVLPATLMDEVSIARFKQEGRAAGRLDHPNIVTIHDAGRLEGIHYLVMAFVDGTDLARLVQSHGLLKVADACEVVRQAAHGLQHAFERGLVHRDVKPSNLMLARDGLVKVLDLGIARSFAETPAVERLTATGMLLGTADYLAPEQWENPNAVDTRADIYSLGCTLYHLLAGYPPFGPGYGSILTKMRAHLEDPVPPIAEARPDIPAELVNVLETMLAKNREERFSTPGELAEAIQPFCAGSNLTTLLDSVRRSGNEASTVTPTISAADTVQPSRSSTAKPATARRKGGKKRIGKWLGVLVAAGVVCAALAAFLFLWPRHDGRQIPNPPVKITGINVNHYRGQDATLIGDLAKAMSFRGRASISSTATVHADDSVRVAATLSTPAHCFLIAFNPDGSEQLCYPEDPDLAEVKYPQNKNARSMSVAPPKSETVRYPREQYFEPGTPGVQAFVLIVSAEPLPAYAEWRSQLDSIPWQKVERDVGPWRWEFDGHDFTRIQGERGERVERGSAPREFRDLCNFFRDRPDVNVIWAIAFPVSKK
jgi:serine/threonine protein kinase